MVIRIFPLICLLLCILLHLQSFFSFTLHSLHILPAFYYILFLLHFVLLFYSFLLYWKPLGTFNLCCKRHFPQILNYTFILYQHILQNQPGISNKEIYALHLCQSTQSFKLKPYKTKHARYNRTYIFTNNCKSFCIVIQ